MPKFSKYASDDFERAFAKAFWRKVTARLKRESNALLPFDDVRYKMPIKGQHHLGFRQVPISQIVGSQGRYADFDRAFLPIQSHTRQRWENIDRAHYEKISLPPVDLYKMGEVYFVKDGNHRVSVAREWGQEFIDAYVIEITIPVYLTPDMDADDVELQKEYAAFLEQTQLLEHDPDLKITTRIQGQYATLIEHISFHRWLIGERRQAEVSFEEAATSWYDHVYQPLVVAIREQDIQSAFPVMTETDLYLWIVKYLWHLRVAYREVDGDPVFLAEYAAKGLAGERIIVDASRGTIRRLIQLLQKADWILELIHRQEKNEFLDKTHLLETRPGSNIETALVGQYEILEEQINVHRWYLGEQRHAEVSFTEAATSWYDHVYLPLVGLIREQKILDNFPGRIETDLYLWLIENHQNKA